MSNFSFSHSVFKRLVLQTRKNQGLFGKGLTLSQKNLSYVFTGLQYKSFENSVAEGETAFPTELSTIFLKLNIVPCNLIQFGRV